MPRKPVVEHNGVKVWRVYDGSESRTYWFALDPKDTDDGGEDQFDVRDLVTFNDEYDSSKSWSTYSRKILKAIRDAIDIGHLMQAGIVPTAEQIAEQEQEEREYEEKHQRLWSEMLTRFK